MAVQLNQSSDPKQDITRNLASLTFESALEDEEIGLLHLRPQCHAHTVVACANAVFLISVLNEAREVRADLARPAKQRRAIKLLTADFLPKDPLLTGIVGCGRIGTHLANCLLSIGELKASELEISTRRPETLGALRSRGVSVYYDNAKLASRADVLFLCVLPSQFPKVLQDIQHHLREKTLVYSLASGISAVKMGQMLGKRNLLVPDFVFSADEPSNWNCSMGIQEALENEAVVEVTCPLSTKPKECCVYTTEKWVELVICAFANMCTHLALSAEASIDLIHGILFGLTTQQSESVKFLPSDFIINWSDADRMFPLFNLVKLHSNDSRVLMKLQTEPYRNAFISRYNAFFSQYRQWKKYNQGT